MKTETINFREFLKNEKPVEDIRLHSSMLLPFGLTFPHILKTAFLNQGVLLVSCVGAVAVTLAILENKLVKEGDEINADRVATIGKIIFPLGALIYVTWFLGKVTFMFL